MLRECLLIAQDEILVEHYRRLNMRDWGMNMLGPADTLELTCIPLNLSIADLYRGIDFLGASIA